MNYLIVEKNNKNWYIIIEIKNLTHNFILENQNMYESINVIHYYLYLIIGKYLQCIFILYIRF